MFGPVCAVRRSRDPERHSGYPRSDQSSGVHRQRGSRGVPDAGVKINDKHFEVIVRQMMNKVKIEDPGDTRFMEEQIVDKWEFMNVNDELYDKVVVTDAGDSEVMKPGMIVTLRKLRDETRCSNVKI